jgi:ParB family chromosome partitioning protein
MEKTAKKTRGLGKGLNELLASALGNHTAAIQNVTETPAGDLKEDHSTPQTTQFSDGLKVLRIEKLHPGPFQPRLSINNESLEQLAESIKVQGILQPIVVRQKGKNDEYEIVAGERRWRAAQLAGLFEIPVIIKEIPDQIALAIALVENIQRENLNPIEEAKALKRLADEMELTHQQVSEAVGKSRSFVTNLIRLLSLNDEVQSLLEQGDLEMGHARALLSLKGGLQSQVAKTVVGRKLSVRETERLVQKLQGDTPKKAKPTHVSDPNIDRLVEDLTDKLGSRVMIRHGQRGHGMLVIHYNNVDELEGILAHIK